jgi:hypothetical protein
MSARKPRLGVPEPGQRRIDQEDESVRKPADFSDPESERVLDAAARSVARELGRQAARELWEQAVRR